MTKPVTRRTALALGVGGLSLLAARPRTARAAFDRLTLYGAPIGVSLPLAEIVDRNGLRPQIGRADLSIWRSPDEMRAGVAADRIDITTAPAPAAANLYNRGTGMRLAAVLTTGMLYLMATDPGITRLEDLAGRTVLVPFRGDMPDRVFQLLLNAAGMTTDDVAIRYVATPREAAQLLVAGQAPAAVLQEPAATLSMLRGVANAVRVRRVVDFQERYGALTGRGADIPMAVLILRDRVLDQAPDLAGRLVAELRAATRWVVDNPTSAARLGEDYLGLRQPVLERSIPFMNLAVRSATEAREHLSMFLEDVAGREAALLGGRLPDAGFYLDV